MTKSRSRTTTTTTSSFDPKKKKNHFWFYVISLAIFIPSTTSTSPTLINFGDSNSDTGGVLAGAGLPIGLPHGITFFHRGTGRLGDGRLIIDFFCEFLN